MRRLVAIHPTPHGVGLAPGTSRLSFTQETTSMAEAFAGIAKIGYEGPQSKNMLAFRHYDPDAVVEGKTDARPSTVRRLLLAHFPRHRRSTPSVPRTMIRPWEKGGDTLEAALSRVEVAFEFHGEARLSASTASTTATSPPREKTLAESAQESRHRGRRTARNHTRQRTGHQAACGARPTSSQTPATCMARPPAAMPRSLPMPPRR